MIVLTIVATLVAMGPVARAQAPAHAAPARIGTFGADGAVMALLRQVAANLRSSRYVHDTRVDERAGRYEFDCSGFTTWVLARTTRQAHRAVLDRTRGRRPLARDYYALIAAMSSRRPLRGWARVSRVEEALPGDVIAWLRPRQVRSANTGHVGFVVERPARVPGVPNAFTVRIADASQYQHDEDSRAGTGRTGFGFGTILVVADPMSGAPVAYGWFGVRSPWVLATQMAIGRPLY